MLPGFSSAAVSSWDILISVSSSAIAAVTFFVVPVPLKYMAVIFMTLCLAESSHLGVLDDQVYDVFDLDVPTIDGKTVVHVFAPFSAGVICIVIGAGLIGISHQFLGLRLPGCRIPELRV